MAEPDRIKYLREAAVDQLRSDISKNLEKYKLPEVDWTPELSEGDVRTSSITFTRSLPLKMPEPGDEKDARNACTIYNAMQALTPQQATDERIWAYLTHFHYREYVRKRWPFGVGDKWDAQKRQGHILTHYFISGSRGLSRDNAISRLWWVGWIAARCTESLNCELDYLLEVLLRRQDVRASLLERPGLGTSLEVFKAVMRHLIADYEEIKDQTDQTDKSKGILFQRDYFRKMMKQLNRAGGMIVLNALETDDLNALVTGIVQKIKQDHKKEMASSKSS